MNKMRTPLTGLLALVMMLMATQVTSAAVFNRFPNASCPDTMSIKYLKDHLDVAGTCNPQWASYAVSAGAPTDTVLGVGGIITAFDEIPTGFDLFIQTTGGGPNTGIDVFTHGTNFRQPYGFNLGDSVIVEWAGVANFNGDIELASPNNNFSNPDIVLRKVNSGNTLPPFFTGTTTDLRELPTNTTFAPYVSALVHLNGPVRVARTSLTGGLTFNSMLVVSDAAPSDSVFIDYAKFTNIVPPAVGTVINSIQGVGNKVNARGFRIMPRNGDDIQDNVPPSLSDSYAIADNKYRVVFDRSVTAGTATNTGNYTLGSFGSVDAAVMDGSFASVLTVSATGLSHGQSESVQVNGITGVSNGQTMTTPQQRSFLAGVLSCGEMAQPNPDTLATGSGGVPCVDKPLYSGAGGEFLNGNFGPRSTVTGIVVGQFGNLYYMEDGKQDPAVNQINSRGITVFAPPQNLVVGHRYVIAGACQDFWQETEFAAIQYIQDQGVAGVPTAWLSLTPDIMALGDPCDATQTQLTPRDYLSTLVRMTGLKVVAKQLTPGTPGARLLTGNNGFWVAGPSPTYADTFIVENLNTALGTNSSSNVNYPALDTPLNVTGVLHFTNNPASPNTAANTKSFRIVPRSAADLSPNVGVDDVGTAALSFSAFPNPGRMVNLAFTLQRSTHIDLAVYDLLGRKVVTLAKGTYPAGNFQKSWNRTDAAGNKVGSGVYFYRLRAGDEVRTARTLLLSD